MNEPELASGDSGEWVTQLQTRLHALGRYTGALDGNFGEQTMAAVVQLQQDQQLTADGTVGAQTWAALGEAERAAGLFDHASTAADLGLVPGTLSEDQQWRWDGESWQPAEDHAPAAVAAEQQPAAGHVSANGQWLWDGTGWKPVNQ